MKDLNFLFQGKLIDVYISDESDLILMRVMIPKNVNDSIVGESPLFEMVSLEFRIEKHITGFLHQDFTITKCTFQTTFKLFADICFMSDIGFPSYINDVDRPQLVNVHHKRNINSGLNEIEFVIPIGDNMPYLKFAYSRLDVFDLKQKQIDTLLLIESMRPFYEDGYMRKKDRQAMELEVLHQIRGSVEFYENKLSNDYWFERQFNHSHISPKIKKELGSLTKPLWLLVDKESFKFDKHGSIDELVITGATKVKTSLSTLDYHNLEVFWMPSEDYFTNLNVVINELLNCESDDPFEHVLDLYFKKWFPTDFIDKRMVHDLKKVVDSNELLNKHRSKDHFFNKIKFYIDERQLVEF